MKIIMLRVEDLEDEDKYIYSDAHRKMEANDAGKRKWDYRSRPFNT
jgi:hypothetical protein